MQDAIKQNWTGVDAAVCGKPGNSKIVNTRYREDEKSAQQLREQENFEYLFEMALKIKELEELRDMRLAQKRFDKV